MTSDKRKELLLKMEKRLIGLSLRTKNLEIKAKEMRDILYEYNTLLQLITTDVRRDVFGDDWHDGYFDGFNEGLCYNNEGNKIREWENIE